MTNKQVQNLLAFLGYYTLTYGKTGVTAIDGDWGTKSQAACKAFQKDFGLQATGKLDADTEKALRHAVAYGMPEKEERKPEEIATPSCGTVRNDSGTFWEDIPDFTRSEFACKCGQYCDGFPAEPGEKLVRLAQQMRNHFGRLVIVSSGVRCQRHNAIVNGVSNSRHLLGKAMDFTVKGVPAATVLAYIQSLTSVRYAYAIDNSYVHMDVD